MRTTYDAESLKGIFNTPTAIDSLQRHFQESSAPVEMKDAGTCYECVMASTRGIVSQTGCTVSQTAMKATLNPGGKQFRLEWYCSLGHKGATNDEEVYPTPKP